MTHYRFVDIAGVRVFYREAGDPSRPTLLLLHGFPTSSHMFRDLLRDLAGEFHLVAPDLPGFGFSDTPDRAHYRYTFENLASTVSSFTDALCLSKFALYVFDYGAPVGWRLAATQTERIQGIITQNGNAYEEGLSGAWEPLRAYWAEPTATHREALRSLLTRETTRWQYLHGVPDPESVAPEAYTLDAALLERPGIDQIQLDLFLDYANNITAYDSFQQYFRSHQPPLLAIWGRYDPFFLPAGAYAFQRDLPQAQVHMLDTGHFALETHHEEIAAHVRAFMRQLNE